MVYPSNTALYADPRLTESTDYTRRYHCHDLAGRTVVIAPHGGDIESGTSELCLAIAGHHPGCPRTVPPLYDYWMFEGVRGDDNTGLHVTSTKCDDPVALFLCGGSTNALSVHGCRASSAGLPTGTQAVLVGGRNEAFRQRLLDEFRAVGITAFDACDHGCLGGVSPHNIVNRTRTAEGGQLELTSALRRSMFAVDTVASRKHTTTEVFWRFVRAARAALASIDCLEPFE